MFSKEFIAVLAVIVVGVIVLIASRGSIGTFGSDLVNPVCPQGSNCK